MLSFNYFLVTATDIVRTTVTSISIIRNIISGSAMSISTIICKIKVMKCINAVFWECSLSKANLTGAQAEAQGGNMSTSCREVYEPWTKFVVYPLVGPPKTYIFPHRSPTT